METCRTQALVHACGKFCMMETAAARPRSACIVKRKPCFTQLGALYLVETAVARPSSECITKSKPWSTHIEYRYLVETAAARPRDSMKHMALVVV